MGSSFEPEHGPHALIESVLFVNFKPEIDDAIINDSLKEVDHLLELLPERQNLTKFEFKISPDGGEMAMPMVSGAEFYEKDETGDVRWQARIASGRLSIHCLDYTRWQDVKAKMLDIFDRLISGLPENTKVANFGLRNSDKFRFSGDVSDYRFSDLFDEDCNYIAPIVRAVGSLWHCNTGWFENAQAAELGDSLHVRLLNQLNLGSAVEAESEEDDKTLFCKIDHNLVVQLMDSEYHLDDRFKSYLKSSVDSLHKKNKSVLAQLLNGQMQRRINLQSGQSTI